MIDYKNIEWLNAIYVGVKDWEVYYLSFDDENIRWWSFMWLRPATEDELRARARETDITELYNIEDLLLRYIDEEKFADDMEEKFADYMEEQWLEHHALQWEIEADWETYYMWFSSWQDIFNYFSKNNITDYDSYTNHFDEVWLTKDQFDAFMELINKWSKSDNDTPYAIWSEQWLAQEKTRAAEKAEFLSLAQQFGLI